MKLFMGFALLGLNLAVVACSTSLRAPLAASTAPHAKTVAQVVQAPAGFDNRSNGLADEPTHQADQAKFEEFETLADGLGPLYNAQSCRECHQSPVSGGVSQVMELRVGHKGGDGTFQNAEIPINHGSEIIKGRTLVSLRAICRSSANRMRTAPLWGVRLQPMLMHDGASLTFRDAILRHRGEASDVTKRFEKLSPADQQAIVEFLRSL